MNNNKKSLILVITISLLIVLIVATTYSYFASYNDSDFSNIVVTSNATDNNSIFVSTGVDINFDVKANDMQQKSDYYGEVASDNGMLNVSYLAGIPASISCTYDIYYRWLSGEYTITDINQNEFTYEMKLGNDVIKSETNFVESNNISEQLVTSGRTITNNSQTDATIQSYDIKVRFYNINKDQNINANKSWKLEFYVGNIEC